MDFNKIIARAKSLLLTPKSEWPVIAAEPATAQELLIGYALPLAALAAIAKFIKLSIIGFGAFGIGGRVGIGFGLSTLLVGLLASLVATYVMALVIDMLAPTFGATRDPTQALKTAVYACTAGWIGGVFILLSLPLGAFLGLVGLCYGAYLMFVGLPHTMKAPPEKAAGYAVVSIIVIIVVSWILAAVLGSVGLLSSGSLGGGLFGSGLSSSTYSSDGGNVNITGGALGGLAQIASQAEKAGKEMEAAQKSGDTDAQARAAGNLLAGVLGGGAQVESLPPDRIKSFVPATLAGLPQESIEASRNGAMGMQVSEARARYGDGANRSVELEITDMGSARGLMGLAAWVNVEEDKQTQTGYEKTYKQGENMIHEQWDKADKRGEYSAVVAGRFMVKVAGNAGSIDELKSALGGVDLAGLAALRNEGVKAAN